MAAKNTRRNLRIPCKVAARAEGPRGPVRGFCRSLSRGGMFFSGTQLPVGQSVEVQVELPAGSFRATGEVRYHHADAEGVGMGVRFTRLAQEHVDQIARYVDQHAP